MPRGPELRLRKVSQGDLRDLWQWRNDRFARLNSVNRKTISPAEHRKWFLKSLRDPRRKIYIGLLNKNKVGMVRFDFYRDQIIEVSINMNPDFRRRGLGEEFLKASSDRIKKKFSGWIQKALIKPSNPASEKIFSSTGFVKIHGAGEHNPAIWVRR